MLCETCGATVDIKQKKCPICMEKNKNRMVEYKNLKRYSRKNKKKITADVETARIRASENHQAYFGRKKRTAKISVANEIVILIIVTIILIILSAGLYKKVRDGMNSEDARNNSTESEQIINDTEIESDF